MFLCISPQLKLHSELTLVKSIRGGNDHAGWKAWTCLGWLGGSGQVTPGLCDLEPSNAPSPSGEWAEHSDFLLLSSGLGGPSFQGKRREWSLCLYL